MLTYLKTMNKRQALKGLLEDEEAQEQSTTHAHVSLRPPLSPQSTTGQGGESSKQYSHETSDQDELDWYEE